MGKNREPTSGLEPLTCSLRVRFGPLYLSRKVAYLQRKGVAAYRRVMPNYAQVSLPVSVSRPRRELLFRYPSLEPTPQPLVGCSWVVAPDIHVRAGSGCKCARS